jgi:uncharacterized repeat protein (TIGR03837 family)
LQRTNNNIDIFCHVIDNFGDAGVVLRLAKEYQYKFPEAEIRIFTDDLSAFQVISPVVQTDELFQAIKNISYIHYSLLSKEYIEKLVIPELVIEAFACDIPEIYLQKAANYGRLLINLDYLMAEDWIEGFHGKESMLGYSRLRKYFFMPGFTINTGGLLPESHLDCIRPLLKEQREMLLNQFLTKYINSTYTNDSLVGTIFSYEHNYSNLFEALLKLEKTVLLFILGNKSQLSWKYLFDNTKVELSENNVYNIQNLTIIFADFLPQNEYDLLLNLTDFNIVRGEDSFARAVLSGKPFLWHCYLQTEKYHLVKVEAFLNKYLNYIKKDETIKFLTDLFIKFNEREFDNFTEMSTENYDYFLKNLSVISESNINFADFLRNNCNLVEKLLYFVRCLPE